MNMQVLYKEAEALENRPHRRQNAEKEDRSLGGNMNDGEELGSAMRVLANVLSSDGEKRMRAESELKSLRENDPDRLILLLLKVLQLPGDKQSCEFKKLSAVLIKQQMSSMSPMGQATIWSSLAIGTQETLKSGLLDALLAEKDHAVARNICFAIAELHSSLQDFDEEWPEVTRLVNRLIAPRMNSVDSASELDIALTDLEIGFLLLNEIFPYVYDVYEEHMDDLLTAFQHALKSESIPVRVSCVEALCNVANSVESQTAEPFAVLLPLVADTLVRALKTHDEETLKRITEALTSIADNEARFFRPSFLVYCSLHFLSLRIFLLRWFMALLHFNTGLLLIVKYSFSEFLQKTIECPVVLEAPLQAMEQ